MPTHDLLVEIGCEELPPTTLATLSQALCDGIKIQLDQAQLTYTASHPLATPRRLAVQISGLADNQLPRQIERQGPSVAAAYDKNGTPTLACLGFARSCGVTADQLQIKETAKGKRVCCSITEPGRATSELVPSIIATAIKKLPIIKPMRWGEHALYFVRPVHWVVVLYGKTLINTKLLGLNTSRETYGHRFHHPKKLVLNQAQDYQQMLYTHGMVMVDYQQRKAYIRKAINSAAQKMGNPIIKSALLDEVTAMVEWPVALLGQFKTAFLSLPPEVLVTVMETHQRYFPIVDANQALQPYFVLISNIESKDPTAIIAGNERVINARLADANFFYANDLRITLENRLVKLTQVIFQRELSNMAAKARRIASLAEYLAQQLGEDPVLAKRAGLLAKCDLLSEIVYEFSSLQGIMGYYYALHDKEPKAVALAIKSHYQPRFSGDELPATRLGCCIALADRLDTIVGILGINKAPTGDKDPFALRRAALGVLRLLIEKDLTLDLMQLLRRAQQNYQVTLPNKAVISQAFDFIIERLRAWYLEHNVPADVLAAVWACHPTAPLDFHRRIKAVQRFQTLPQANALTAANKRVNNILKKQKQATQNQVDNTLFESTAERNLAQLVAQETHIVAALYKKEDYAAALNELAKLKQPIDTFFNEVMVMVDDDKIRNNRLALLHSIRTLFSCVADISLLP